MIARLFRAALLWLCASLPALAADPIRWTSWSAELFTRAKAENRLVILDLEAVWCHWCHVMERKTYGDDRVRTVIGAHYIAVRADQDANPDLSGRYGEWGWPATIVFAPDGTEIAKLQGYVEPDEMHGLLQAAVKDPKPGPSVEAAIAVKPADAHFLGKAERAALKRDVDDSYDDRNGGWGAPLKYIDADSLDLAVALAEEGDAKATSRARRTLDRALALIDPVWGGVYQYSDALDWSSPHFEKIMSFQAQYLRQYAQAHARWNVPRYREAARAIKAYMTGFLLGPEGAFYVSQNADLDHEVDGHAFYALDDAGRRAKGMPRIDTNHYARENGWAIGALAAYSDALGDAEALATAEKAARWVIEKRALPEGGFRHGASDRGGPFLGDTVAMGQAFLDLYAATGAREWLGRAAQAGTFIGARFKDELGGFAGAVSGETTSGPHARPAKPIEEQVSATRFLNLLAHYTGKPADRALAEHGMRYLVGAASGLERPLPGILLADRELSVQPTHLTVVGGKDDPEARALHAMARALPTVYRRLDWWDTSEGPLSNPDVEYPDLGKPAAFACSGQVCSLPTFSAAELKATVAQMAALNRKKASRQGGAR